MEQTVARPLTRAQQARRQRVIDAAMALGLEGGYEAVQMRDGAAGVPVSPLPEEQTAEADRNKQWREVGVGAQILRDLGVTSIRNLTSAVHDYKGLSGFGIEIVSSEQLEG